MSEGGEGNDRSAWRSFWFNEGRGGYGRDESFRWGRAVGVGTAAVLTAATLASSIYRNEPREVTLEIGMGGEITQQVSDVGLQRKWPWPFASKIQYSTAMNITPTESQNVRMGDELRMEYAGFECQWNIDPAADYTRLYIDMRGSGEDIESIAAATQLDALTRAAETLRIEDLIEVSVEDGAEPITTGADEPEQAGFVETLSSRFEESLRASYEEQGWPIEVTKCLSKSYRFDSDTETRLARLAGIRQERVELDYRNENAIEAQTVYANEATADAAYIGPLIAEGMSADAAASALCVFKLSAEGKLGEQFTPGCFGGGQDIAVSVPMPGTGAQEAAEPIPE